jgi:hypothetical protein
MEKRRMRAGKDQTRDFKFWNPPKKNRPKTIQRSRRISPDGKYVEYEFNVEIPFTKEQAEKIMLRRFLKKAMKGMGKNNYELENLDEFSSYLWILDTVPKIERQISSIVQKSEDLAQSGNTEFAPEIKQKLTLLGKLSRKLKTMDDYFAEKKKKTI